MGLQLQLSLPFLSIELIGGECLDFENVKLHPTAILSVSAKLESLSRVNDAGLR